MNVTFKQPTHQNQCSNLNFRKVYKCLRQLKFRKLRTQKETFAK